MPTTTPAAAAAAAGEKAEEEAAAANPFAPPSPLDGELDLTNCHLHSLEGVALPDDLTVRRMRGWMDTASTS